MSYWILSEQSGEVVHIAECSGDPANASTNRWKIYGKAAGIFYKDDAGNVRQIANTTDGAPPTGAAGGDLTGTYPNPTIAPAAVSYAKIQDVSATDKVLGRSTAGAGDVEEIACTAAGRALIDDADATAQRTTLGLGSIATVNSPVPIANGGTGQTAQTAAFDALAPTTTKGDVAIHDGSDNIRVAVGANNTVLTADSTQASGVKWATATGNCILSWGGNGGSAEMSFRRNGATSDATASVDSHSTRFIATANGTLKNLYVSVRTAPGAGKTIVYTVRVNGSDTGITCSIADTATAANDTTHTASVTAGQPIEIHITVGAGAPADEQTGVDLQMLFS